MVHSYFVLPVEEAVEEFNDLVVLGEVSTSYDAASPAAPAGAFTIEGFTIMKDLLAAVRGACMGQRWRAHCRRARAGRW